MLLYIQYNENTDVEKICSHTDISENGQYSSVAEPHHFVGAGSLLNAHFQLFKSEDNVCTLKHYVIFVFKHFSCFILGSEPPEPKVLLNTEFMATVAKFN
jgi:hypothetical protein